MKRPFDVFFVFFILVTFPVGLNLSATHPPPTALPPKKTPQETALGATPGLDQSKIDDGWLSLFDGKSLFGWRATTDAQWKIVDREIRASGGTPGLLRTTTQFDDFELMLEFKGEPRTNSGVFLRTSPNPKNLISDCFELNIANRLDHAFPTGSIVDRIATEHDYPIDRWSQMRVVAIGPKLSVWINGTLAVEHHSTPTDNSPGRGYIGLQTRTGAIAFRNIILRPLNVPPMNVSPDLKEWKTDQTLASEFSATANGELSILGGRGQLETEKRYADFVFSMKCKTNADGLNSGIFFRCIPGSPMNGYESQIQNQFKEGDRRQPVDCGTGGIFRRVNARQVNANDREWFNKTIIASGAHVGIWVNGYQVTDWSDQRPESPNPRKGKRLAAGSIMIQGHDPTTDILMKDFRIKEMKSRR